MRALLLFLMLTLGTVAYGDAPGDPAAKKDIPFKKEEDLSGALAVLAVLGVIAAGAVIATRKRAAAEGGPRIVVLANRRIGMRTGLVLVRVRGKEFLLANTSESLTVIDTWPADEREGQG